MRPKIKSIPRLRTGYALVLVQQGAHRPARLPIIAKTIVKPSTNSSALASRSARGRLRHGTSPPSRAPATGRADRPVAYVAGTNGTRKATERQHPAKTLPQCR